MELIKGGPDQALNRAAVDKVLSSSLEQRESVEGKLTSLEKYTTRLDAISDWMSSTKSKLIASRDSSQVASLANEVADRETDVKEVLGNFTNLEKECQVVQQIVSSQLQVFSFLFFSFLPICCLTMHSLESSLVISFLLHKEGMGRE